MPLFVAPLLVLSFYSFASYLLESKRTALLATAIQFAIFWALDFRDAGFSNHVSYILLWTSLRLALGYVKEGRRSLGAAAVMVVFGLVLVHLIIAEFFFISFGAYLVGALVLRKRNDLARGLMVLGVALLVVAPLLFFRIDVGDTVSADDASGPVTGTLSRPPWPGQLLTFRDPIGLYPGRISAGTVAYASAIFLIPGAVAGRRRDLFLVTSMAVVPAIILNDPLVDFLMPRLGSLPLARLPFLLPQALVLAAMVEWSVRALRDWLESEPEPEPKARRRPVRRRRPQAATSGTRFSAATWRWRYIPPVGTAILALVYLAVFVGRYACRLERRSVELQGLCIGARDRPRRIVSVRQRRDPRKRC